VRGDAVVAERRKERKRSAVVEVFMMFSVMELYSRSMMGICGEYCIKERPALN
jgi:hypothetical protein